MSQSKPTSALYSAWLYILNSSKAMENAIHAANEHELVSYLHDSLISLNNAQLYVKTVPTAAHISSHLESAVKDVTEFIKEASKTEIEKFEGTVLYNFMATLGIINISIYDLLESEVKKQIIPAEKIIPPVVVTPHVCAKLIVNSEGVVLENRNGQCEGQIPLKIEYIPPKNENVCKDIKIGDKVYKLQKDKNGSCIGNADILVLKQ